MSNHNFEENLVDSGLAEILEDKAKVEEYLRVLEININNESKEPEVEESYEEIAIRNISVFFFKVVERFQWLLKLHKHEVERRQRAEKQLQADNTRISEYEILCRQKNFPIQGSFGPKKYERTVIPYWLAEVAYEYYVEKFGNQQSLERLMQRGGFGREELVALIRRDLKITIL